MTTTKLAELTPRQRDRMSSWAREWIEYGWRTTPLTEEEWAVWETGARKCYEFAGMPWPNVVVRVSSPIVGTFAAPVAKTVIDDIRKKDSVRDSVRDSVWDGVRASVGDGVKASVGDSVRASVWTSVRDSVRASVRASVWNSVGDSVADSVRASVSVRDSVWASVRASLGDGVKASVEDSVRDSVWTSVRDSVRASVWNSVGDSVRDSVRASVGDSVWDSVGGVRASVRASVWDSVGDSVRASVPDSVWASVRDSGDSVWGSVRADWQNYFGGRMWCDWDAYFAFLRDVVQHHIDGDTWDRSRAFQDAQSAGWWWPMRDFVMVCDTPAELHIETAGGRHRMHCGTGPAIRWADGWGVHMWHGTRVPADLIETDWDVEKIMAERNTEVRRCAIEKMGWDRFVVEAGMKLADEAPDPGNPGQVLRLYDIPRDVLDLPVRVLVAHNATRERDGSRHTFGLTTPTDCKTATAAAAWCFDLTEKEYRALERAT